MQKSLLFTCTAVLFTLGTLYACPDRNENFQSATRTAVDMPGTDNYDIDTDADDTTMGMGGKKMNYTKYADITGEQTAEDENPEM